MKLSTKIIKRIESYLNFYSIEKTASLVEDLQKEKDLQKYFVSEEEAKEKLKQYEAKKKKNPDTKYYASDYDWYKVEGESPDFYLYQDFSIGISNILYARCKVLQLNRCGYDDPVSIAGLYEAEDTTNTLIGYKIFYDSTYMDAVDNIREYGIYDKEKHHYLCNKKVYYDFNMLKEVAMQFVNNKDSNTGQTFYDLNQ